MTAHLSPTRTRRLVTAWLWVAALLPASYYLVELPNFGSLPYNDYYHVLWDLTTEEGFSREPGTWLKIRSNEHRVTIPALVYLANYWVTGGDNRGHSVVTLACMFGLLILLTRWIGIEKLRSERLGLLLVPAISLLLFNPVQSHNVVLGFSGVMWLSSNLFAVAAITALTQVASDTRAGWGAAGLGLLGAVCYSSNLMLWPVLAIGCLLQRARIQRWGPIVASGIAVYVFYFGTYEKPAIVPPFETSPGTIIRYGLAYLGGIFTDQPEWAIAIGGLGVLTFSVLSFLGLRPGRPAAVWWTAAQPWLLLGLFSLGNAIGTGVGRSGFSANGLGMVFSSRYANVACLFWIGVFAAGSLAVASRRQPARASSLGLASLGVLLVGAGTWAMFDRGHASYQSRLDNAHRQELAEIALRYRLADEDLYRPVTRWSWSVQRMSGRLETLGHVPFDRDLDLPFGFTVSSDRLRMEPKQRLTGGVEVARVQGKNWHLEGRMQVRRLPPVRRLILLDAEHTVRGFAFANRRSPDRSESRTDLWWTGTARPAKGQRLAVWVQFEGSETLHRMRGIHFQPPETAPDTNEPEGTTD